MFFDAPFGLKRELWDGKMLEPSDWALMITRIKGLARLSDCQFILQHLIDGNKAYKAEMTDVGLKNVSTWFWYKPGQNQANVQVVQAVETLTIGSQVVGGGAWDEIPLGDEEFLLDKPSQSPQHG